MTQVDPEHYQYIKDKALSFEDGEVFPADVTEKLYKQIMQSAYKAWMIFPQYDDERPAILIHAETRNKARKRGSDMWPDLMGLDYVDAGARRVPELDDKPFTDKNVRESDCFETDGEDEESNYDYRSDCGCELCKKKAVP